MVKKNKHDAGKKLWDKKWENDKWMRSERKTKVKNINKKVSNGGKLIDKVSMA